MDSMYFDQWFSVFLDLRQPFITFVNEVLLNIKNQNYIYYSTYLFAEGLGSGMQDCLGRDKPESTQFISSHLTLSLWLRISGFNGLNLPHFCTATFRLFYYSAQGVSLAMVIVSSLVAYTTVVLKKK